MIEKVQLFVALFCAFGAGACLDEPLLMVANLLCVVWHARPALQALRLSQSEWRQA